MLLGDGEAGDLTSAVACPRIGSGCCRPLGDSPGKITFYRRKRADIYYVPVARSKNYSTEVGFGGLGAQ